MVSFSPMRFFRRLTALLLLVAFPAYALASLGVLENCPMQAMPMDEMAETGHACCDPADATADGEQGQPEKPHPCKPGQSCKTGSLHDGQIPRLNQSSVTAERMTAAPEPRVPFRDPVAVWRPPTSKLTSFPRLSFRNAR